MSDDAAADGDGTNPVDDLEVALLLDAIHARYGCDLRGYTRGSMKRRVLHATAAMGLRTVSELQGLVLRDGAAFERLVSLLTVSVTELFRDPPFFRALRDEVFPYLRTFAAIKIWVAGCSTGEEALSLCIALHEEGLLPRARIYATDIDTTSLEAARKGICRQSVIAGYARNYRDAGGRGSLADYFVADYDAVAFDPRLLENVIFAEHSLATDAVFSEAQLVTCRNVLIYFDRQLQERAFDLFADSLCAGGFLGLGSHERVRAPAHFTSVGDGGALYRRTPDRVDFAGRM